MDRVFWRAVDREVWAGLHAVGFTSRQRDRVWREKPDRIEVVQIHALRLGGMSTELPRGGQACAIEVGVILRAVPSYVEAVEGTRIPDTAGSHIRARLDRNEPQLSRMPDVWYVNAERSNLQAVIDEMRRLLLSDGLAWFDSYASAQHVLDLLLHGETADVNMGSGGINSQVRDVVAGFVALSLGHYDDAIELFSRAREREDVPWLRDQLSEGLQRALARGAGTRQPVGDTDIGPRSPPSAKLHPPTKPDGTGGALSEIAELSPRASGKELASVDVRYLIRELGLKEHSTELDLDEFFASMARAARALGGDFEGEAGQAVVQRIREASWAADEGANYRFEVDLGDGPVPVYFSYRWEDENTIALYLFSPPRINAILRRLTVKQRTSRMSAEKRARFRAFVQEHGKELGARGGAPDSDAEAMDERHDDE